MQKLSVKPGWCCFWLTASSVILDRSKDAPEALARQTLARKAGKCISDAGCELPD